MYFTEVLKTLILIHAALGGVALLSGSIAIFTKKGSKAHIYGGRLFYYSLGISIVFSLVVAVMPDHYNPFLFSVGIFSGYFIIIGKRAIRYKNHLHTFTIDKYIHMTMLACCIAIIIIPIWVSKSFHIVAGVFGFVGLLFALKNLLELKNPHQIRKDWLKIHIGHISGGYIAAVSAFFVVNGFLPGVFNWFLPGIIGGVFISYSIRKVDSYKKSVPAIVQPFKIIPFVIFISFSTCSNVFCQSDASQIPYGKEVGLRIGITKTNIQDQRLSAKSFTNWSPKYGVVFGSKKENSWSHNIIDFTYVTGHKKDPYFTINSIIISATYSYQRKVSEGFWMGGFTKHHTILNFPKSVYGSIFTNNAISYTISQSIGPKISYAPTSLTAENKTISGLSSLQFPILAYLIQPIYGHPYPEQYLREGTFCPTRSGMAWPMVKSGKLVSLARYKSIQLELGIFYYISDRFKIGVAYEGELFYANANGKSVKLNTNDIVVSPGYLY